MENRYYACKYDVLRNNTPHSEIVFKQLKVKIARLHILRPQRVMIDN